MILQVAKLGPVSRAAGMDCEYPLDVNQASLHCLTLCKTEATIKNEESEAIWCGGMHMEYLGCNDMQHILRSARIGVWRVEFEAGRAPRFYADRVMDELLGISGDVTPEKRFLYHRAHIHKEDQELFEEYAAKLAKEPTEIVYRFIHPITGEMYVRCGGKRESGSADTVRIVGTHQDISDTARLEKSKQAERRLAELNQTLKKEHILQQDYYRELLDIQNCGLMAYTLPEHRLIHMNAEALRMYRCSDIEEAQQNIGKILKKLYYPDPDTVSRLTRLREVNDMVDYECIIHKGTEQECHIMAKTKIFMTPAGERAVVTTFIDISKMILLQKALQQAEEGSRAKSAFLFNMSHDLRTPMNAIIGYGSLMERHWGEEEITWNYLCKQKKASRCLLSLINNVLEMARIESGKEVLRETEWSVQEFNDNVDVIMEGVIHEKQLQFERKFRVQHEQILCDPLKVREIFMNLLSNAIKYTPAGGKISMDIEEIDCEQEGYATFRTLIKDTGIGISKEYLPHLFERFSREQNSAESGITGTGLGLSIVKSLVDLMDGSISVESTLHEGTTFTVTLTHRIAEHAGTKKADTQKEALDAAVLAGIRILLAEDNALNAEIAETILQDAGIIVEHAINGAQALAMVEKAPMGYYDLILMDIQMPCMDGYESTRRIRKLPDERSQTPIVAMTANAFEEDRKAAFAVGMNGYVVKPIELPVLMETMAAVLPQAGSHQKK